MKLSKFDIGAEIKNARIVRLFVCHQIQKYFPAYNFSHKILPVVLCKGKNGTPLLHFVVIGIKADYSAAGILTYQQLNEVLDQKFITIESNQFINLDSPLGEFPITELNPVKLFTQSKTYKELWQ